MPPHFMRRREKIVRVFQRDEWATVLESFDTDLFLFYNHNSATCHL